MLKYLCRLIVPLSLGVLQAEKPKESKTTTECTIKDFGIEKNVNIRNRLSTSQPPTKHFYATLLHVEEYTCITFYILFVIMNYVTTSETDRITVVNHCETFQS